MHAGDGSVHMHAGDGSGLFYVLWLNILGNTGFCFTWVPSNCLTSSNTDTCSCDRVQGWSCAPHM